MGQRILRMSDVFLPVIFGNRDGGGWRVWKNPLPADAKVVRAWMEIGRYGLPEVALAMESVAWPEVVPGDALRDVEPLMIESIRPELCPELSVRPAMEATLGPTAEPPEVLWFEGGPWKGAFLCPHPVRNVVELPRLAGGQYVYRDAGRRTDDGRRIFEVQISHAEPEPPKLEESSETNTRLRRHEIALRETPGYREAFLAWFKGQATPDQLRLLGEANGIKSAEPEPPKAAEPEGRIKFREFL